jgi:hypothetical protein
MEDLALLDKNDFLQKTLMDNIWLSKNHQDNEKKIKIFKDGNLMLWLHEDPKIKEGNF